jgi:hypothetical protein
MPIELESEALVTPVMLAEAPRDVGPDPDATDEAEPMVIGTITVTDAVGFTEFEDAPLLAAPEEGDETVTEKLPPKVADADIGDIDCDKPVEDWLTGS